MKNISLINHCSLFKQKINLSKIWSMTEFSGALNNCNFDGNTSLLECEVSKFVYIAGLEIF